MSSAALPCIETRVWESSASASLSSSGIHALPKDLLINLLRASKTGSFCGGGYQPNPFLLLRAVCREFRQAADEAVEDFHVSVKLNNKLNEALLQRVVQWLQHVPSRWPNLRHLALEFDWRAEDLERALRAVAQSCPRLQRLELRAKESKMQAEVDDRPCLAPLSALSALDHLELSGFKVFTNWAQGLPSVVPSLTHLGLSYVKAVELEFPPGLITLEVEQVEGTFHLHPSILDTRLKKLTLQHVTLSGMLQVPSTIVDVQFTWLGFVGGGLSGGLLLTDLERLQIFWCGSQWLPSLIQNTRLRCLDLHGVEGLTALPELSHLLMLQELEISCLAIPNLHTLTNLSQLKSLRIDACPNIVDLPEFTRLTSLEVLELEDLERLTSLSRITALRSLNTLVISSIGLNLTNVLTSLSALTELDLRNTGTADDPLPDLCSLTQLRILEIINSHVRELPNLLPLVALDKLFLWDSPNLESVSCSRLPASLRTLTVDNTRVKELQGVIPRNLKSCFIGGVEHVHQG